MDLQPPDHHHLLVFWVSLLLLVAVARLLGRLCQRVGQPAVVGELAAGVLLGPSVLGRLAPDVTAWLFPADAVQGGMLFAVAWLGVAFLLLSTGFETDLPLVRRLGRAAASVSTASLVLPMAAGVVVAVAMPATLRGDVDPVVFVLFVATALSISSLPVIATVLREMGFMRRDVGQLTLAAGMVNDVVGWIALGIIAGLAQAGSISLGQVLVSVGGVALFFVVAATLGQRVLDGALRRARARQEGAASTFTAVLVLTLAGGAATQWIGVEAVLGAFVVGVLLGRSRYADEALLRPVEIVTTSFLAPVFFATAGLRVDLGVLADAEVVLWTVVVVVAASVGKLGGAALGGALARLPGRESLALGVGLNARGALEIVIASVGLSLGVLNETSYAMVVVMAIVTSMAAPPLLRAVLGGYAGTEDEQRRLDHEATMRTNVVVGEGRLLVPSQGGPGSVLAARVLDLAWPAAAGATVITVDEPGAGATGTSGPGADGPGSTGPGTAEGPVGDGRGPVDLDPVTAVLAGRDVEVVHVRASDLDPDDPTAVVDAVVAHARLGFAVVGIGADHAEVHGDQPLSPLARQLVQRTETPLVVVRRPRDVDLPGAALDGRSAAEGSFHRALVGVTGTAASRAAQEVAANLSAAVGTEVVLTHVDTRGDDRQPGGGGDRLPHLLVEVASDRAGQVGATTSTLTVQAPGSASGLVVLAEERGCDLVVLGATRRDFGERAYLGHTVEQVLRHARGTVVLVVLPEPDPAATPDP